jgi:hypothetical protein
MRFNSAHSQCLLVAKGEAMDYNIDKNQLVFMKTDKTGPDWFLCFTVNRSVTSVTVQNSQILIFFEKEKTGKLE